MLPAPAADTALPLLRTPETAPDVQFLDCGGINIAVRHRPAASGKQQTALFWLGGYRSDMQGAKAQAVDAFAEARGLAATRFDYSGHGQSGGDFYQGTLSLWLAQSMAVFEHYYKNAPLRPILIGSSMGGWLALLLARELQKRGARLGGLLLLAPAPDFTETLIKPALAAQEKRQLAEQGFFTVTKDDVETPYSRALLEDGAKNSVLNDSLLQFSCPIHIVQGMADTIIPYRSALRLMDYLPLNDTALTLIKNGDHRLSAPQHLVFMQKLLENFIQLL